MTEEAILAAQALQQELPDFRPQIAIVLGTGLGSLVDQMKIHYSCSYASLAGFCQPHVEGHDGRVILGELEGKAIICLQGRAHLYEGISSQVICTMVRTCYLLGAHLWLVTNAAGSLRPEVGVGNLVVVKDHINFQFINPLVGKNDGRFGPRFVSLENAYDANLREQLLALAKELNIPLVDGVYLSTLGPTFETPAEINAFRILGADLVGMSTTAEVMVARHCGMKVVAISVITNFAAGLHPVPVTHAETLKGASLSAENFNQLISGFIRRYSGS